MQEERFNEQIRQMIPAHEGYYAVLLDTEDPYYHLERVVAWALVEYEDANSQRQTRIVGLSLFRSGVWFADATEDRSHVDDAATAALEHRRDPALQHPAR
jgi:hypothetical protein